MRLSGFGTVASIGVIASAGQAFAQDVARLASATPAEISTWSQLIGWILTQQRAFHGELSEAFRTLAETGSWAVAFTLIGASFLYGLFHAAGPGHGKFIVTAYLATHRERLRRGVGMAVLASFCQGAVAIALVSGVMALAEWLPVDSRAAIKGSERFSFVLLMLMGCFLVLRAVWSGYERLRRPSGTCGGHNHGGCGHHHVPLAELDGGPSTLMTRACVILSIGLRPCTGAVIVLVFAEVLDLRWAGIAAVAAMSFGTALAIAVLAFIVVNVRSLATRLAGSGGTAWHLSGNLVALAGGVIITAIGYSLLVASLAPPHPLGL